MSEEKRKEELDQANFVLFKTFLYNFIVDKFSVCDGFKSSLIDCKNESEIVKLFIYFSDDVYERLGGNSTLEDEVSDLEYEISNLEDKNSELENEIEELTNKYKGSEGSLFDDYKTNIIIEYSNNYTPWEIEELLKNGKKYLAINNILK